MTEAAERLLTAIEWLPFLLRTSQPQFRLTPRNLALGRYCFLLSNSGSTHNALWGDLLGVGCVLWIRARTDLKGEANLFWSAGIVGGEGEPTRRAA